jgi:hypothetical protein
MGLPINHKEPGCNPISSNCVIWQGPDISCINLCKGDSVTEVVYNLALELCKIMEVLDIDNYELGCLTEEPESIKELLQIIINKICNCCNIDETVPITEAVEKTVNIAPLFYYENEEGDTITSMTVSGYAKVIGLRVQTIVNSITEILDTLADHASRIEELEGIVSNINLEIPVEVIEDITTTKDKITEIDFAIGSANDIYGAIAKHSPTISQEETLAITSGLMSGLEGWIVDVKNLADVINNINIALADTRLAIKGILRRLPSGCDSISINVQGLIATTNLELYFTGDIPEIFDEVGGTTSFIITDTAGAQMRVQIPLKSVINGGAHVISLTGSPLNSGLDFKISAKLNLKSEEGDCQSVIEGYVFNSLLIPVITLNAGEAGAIGYQFLTSTNPDHIYTIELFNSTGTSLIASHVLSNTNPSEVITGKFYHLTKSTTYRVRIKTAFGDKIKTGSFTSITTNSLSCSIPTDVSANITITPV